MPDPKEDHDRCENNSSKAEASAETVNQKKSSILRLSGFKFGFALTTNIINKCTCRYILCTLFSSHSSVLLGENLPKCPLAVMFHWPLSFSACGPQNRRASRATLNRSPQNLKGLDEQPVHDSCTRLLSQHDSMLPLPFRSSHKTPESSDV
jgi:hypothetical protein